MKNPELIPKIMGNLKFKLNTGKISKAKYDEQMKSLYDAYYKAFPKNEKKGPGIENISKSPESTEWFIDPRVKDIVPSAAENIIGDILQTYKVQWYREVSFTGLQISYNGYPRFDFFLPAHWLVVEYDGELFHSTPEQKRMDALKSNWCKSVGIEVIRYSKEHYYSLEKCIGELMRGYSINKKNL